MGESRHSCTHHLAVLKRHIDGCGGGHVGGVAVGREAAGVVDGEVGVAAQQADTRGTTRSHGQSALMLMASQ